jgi:hypothetical protein
MNLLAMSFSSVEKGFLCVKLLLTNFFFPPLFRIFPLIYKWKRVWTDQEKNLSHSRNLGVDFGNQLVTVEFCCYLTGFESRKEELMTIDDIPHLIF